MKISDFLKELTEELELEQELELATDLKKLDEWDSMAAMVVIGYASSNFDVTLNGDDISKISTVDELIDRIGKDRFQY